jgi:nitrogen regulatory protein PII
MQSRRERGCPVTRIEAIIRSSRLDEVREALLRLGVQGLTATEVRGHGRQKGHAEVCRGAEYVVDFVPKVKVEAVVETPRVPAVVEALIRAARTRMIGDGKIFVEPVMEAVRVRTGERGDQVL